jgi:hypothetical protein
MTLLNRHKHLGPNYNFRLVNAEGPGPTFVVPERETHELADDLILANLAMRPQACRWIEEDAFNTSFSGLNYHRVVTNPKVLSNDAVSDFLVELPDIEIFAEAWGTALADLLEIPAKSLIAFTGDPVDYSVVVRAISVMFEVYQGFCTEVPDVVNSGDGGVDIEWDFEESFVSIHISPSDPKFDRIYISNGGVSEHVIYSREVLERIF